LSKVKSPYGEKIGNGEKRIIRGKRKESRGFPYLARQDQKITGDGSGKIEKEQRKSRQKLIIQGKRPYGGKG